MIMLIIAAAQAQQLAGGSSTSARRCGTSWTAADALCGVACPSNTNAECPSGQSCFSDLSVAACGTSGGGGGGGGGGGDGSGTGGTTSGVGGTLRCGVGWADANGKCGTSCSDGTDDPCPNGETCFNNLSSDPCGSSSGSGGSSGGGGGSSGGANGVGATGGGASGLRCGSNWQDAVRHCRSSCTSSADCPSGERCFTVNADACTTCVLADDTMANHSAQVATLLAAHSAAFQDGNLFNLHCSDGTGGGCGGAFSSDYTCKHFWTWEAVLGAINKWNAVNTGAHAFLCEDDPDDQASMLKPWQPWQPPTLIPLQILTSKPTPPNPPSHDSTPPPKLYRRGPSSPCSPTCTLSRASTRRARSR